jgi:hypothetical protein
MAFVGERLRIAECDRVAINVWSKPPHKADWQTTRRHLERLIARHPDGIAALVIFPWQGLTTIRESEVDRVEMQSVTKLFTTSARACAIVVESNGFMSAAVRSALAGLKLVAQGSFPTHYFADDAAAIDWLVPRVLGASAPPTLRDSLQADLQAAVRDARAATQPLALTR